MTLEGLEHLPKDWCGSFNVRELAGGGRWSITTPLIYEDGDALPIFIEATNTGWQLTDAGMACSHLYFDDFEYTEARLRRLQRVVAGMGCTMSADHRIALELDGPPDIHDVGDFLQVVAQVQGVARSTTPEQEQVRYATTLRSDIVKRLLMPAYEENWTPPELNSRATYRADLKVDRASERPVAIFLASTSERTKTAALAADQFRHVDARVKPLLVYRPDTVSDEAVYCFEDYTGGGNDSVLAVRPTEQFKLFSALQRLGVPINA